MKMKMLRSLGTVDQAKYEMERRAEEGQIVEVDAATAKELTEAGLAEPAVALEVHERREEKEDEGKPEPKHEPKHGHAHGK